MKLPIYPIDAFTGRLFGGLLGGAVTTNVAYADALTKAERDKMTPDQVLALMKKAPAWAESGLRIRLKALHKNVKPSAQQRGTVNLAGHASPIQIHRDDP